MSWRHRSDEASQAVPCLVFRELVTAETWKDMSRKVAREKLEEKMGVGTDGLKSVKTEINEILDKIVSELVEEDASVSLSTPLPTPCDSSESWPHSTAEDCQINCF